MKRNAVCVVFYSLHTDTRASLQERKGMVWSEHHNLQSLMSTYAQLIEHDRTDTSAVGARHGPKFYPSPLHWGLKP